MSETAVGPAFWPVKVLPTRRLTQCTYSSGANLAAVGSVGLLSSGFASRLPLAECRGKLSEWM